MTKRELLQMALEALSPSATAEQQEAAITALEAEMAKPEPSCGTCSNRGRVKERSQETYCYFCSRSVWHTDNYARKDDL
jgi:Zn finger protein HypA/HybF involved in hydrogenase expression